VVFGKRKPVDLSVEFITLPAGSNGSLSMLLPGAPACTESNGMQVWLVDASQLNSLRKSLEQQKGAELVFRPRIATSHGMRSRLFQGQLLVLQGTTNQVGLSMECSALVSSQNVDLTTDITWTIAKSTVAEGSGELFPVPLGSIQTNFDAALRLQVRRGGGVFLLKSGAPERNGQCIGILIDPLQGVR